MSLIKIDENSCTMCGGCVDECPARIIAFKDKDSFPVSVENFEPFCINCWHCVTVCPTDALEHRNMPPEKCPDIKRELSLSREQAEQFLRSRRSIRKYKDKPVDNNIIEDLIKTARHAPTDSNSQNVKWLVIHDREKLDRLEDMVIGWMKHMIKEMPDVAKGLNMARIATDHEKGIRTICRGAPHLIIAYGVKADPSSQTNSVIAMSYLELAAVSMGLGTCWAGYFNAAAQTWPPLKEALELPEHHSVCSSMMLGYPEYQYNRLPERNEPDIKFF